MLAQQFGSFGKVMRLKKQTETNASRDPRLLDSRHPVAGEPDEHKHPGKHHPHREQQRPGPAPRVREFRFQPFLPRVCGYD